MPTANWKADYVLPDLAWYEMGPVHLQLTLNYGLDNKQLNSSVVVWYIPIWVFIVLGFLTASLVIIWKYRAKHKL